MHSSNHIREMGMLEFHLERREAHELAHFLRRNPKANIEVTTKDREIKFTANGISLSFYDSPNRGG